MRTVLVDPAARRGGPAAARGAPPGRRPAGGVGLAGKPSVLGPARMLSLQGLAGNRAVTSLVAQRCGDVPPERCGCHHRDEAEPAGAPAGMAAGVMAVQRLTRAEKEEDLRSRKYSGQPRLEAAFDNSPPLGIGERGDGVRLVQEGLVADGLAMPRSTKPTGELDGIFGPETQGAVRQFQVNHAADGLTDRNGFADGRVGRKTLGKLDELAASGERPPGPPDLPPCPVPITGTRALVAGPGGGSPGGLLIPGITCKPGPGPVPPPNPNVQCGQPCGPAWIQVKKGTFMTLCDDKVATSSPEIATVGCTPGRPGNVGLFAGKPGWQISGRYDFCGSPDPTIQVGFVQTVETAATGAFFFNPATQGLDKGDFGCVANARDCERGAPAPFFGRAGTPGGPHGFGGTFPVLSDTPHLTKTSRPDRQHRLHMLVIHGVFHIWLVARLPGGTTVFVHHWTIKLGVGGVLTLGADPCNRSAWQLVGNATVTAKGTGQGSATPVLTGMCANDLTKPCGGP